MLSSIKDVLEICAIIFAGFIAYRINWKFVPIIQLDILYDWIDQERGLLKLKLKVENKSNVKAVKKDIFLQSLQYDLTQINSLSEWVPLSKDVIREGEEPIFWNNPVKVWTTTKVIYPGEITELEYVCSCPKGRLLHVLLKFESNVDYNKIRNYPESWATTKFISNNLPTK